MSEWSGWEQEYEQWRRERLYRDQDGSYACWVRETEEGKKSEMLEQCKVEQLDSSPNPDNRETETADITIPEASPANTPSKQRAKKARKEKISQSPPAAQQQGTKSLA